MAIVPFTGFWVRHLVLLWLKRYVVALQKCQSKGRLVGLVAKAEGKCVVGAARKTGNIAPSLRWLDAVRSSTTEAFFFELTVYYYARKICILLYFRYCWSIELISPCLPLLNVASAHPRLIGQSLLTSLILCTLMATTCSTTTQVPQSASPICASHITNQTSPSKARLVTGTPKPRPDCLFSALPASFTQGQNVSCSASSRSKEAFFTAKSGIATVKYTNIRQNQSRELRQRSRCLSCHAR